jgi:hypothetical protein
MGLESVGSNAVIVARQFNPSVIGQLWLVKSRLLEEGDFLPGCVFTDMAVQVNTREFDLMVVPQQCQFSPRVGRQREQELVVDKVGAIVESLPHTPYRAIGLNFTWRLVPESGDVPTVSRGLFFVEERPLDREFADPSGRFGAYMSKDTLGGRLKLDVKPITVSQAGEDVERIQFAFNFHVDVEHEDDPVARINQVLRQWDAVREESSRILCAAVKEEAA